MALRTMSPFCRLALIAATLSLAGCGSSALAPDLAGARDGALGDVGSTIDVPATKDADGDGSTMGGGDAEDGGRFTDAAIGEGGAPAVDASSLNEKMLLGYQGWFLCPGDGSSVNGWTHWFRNGSPTAANLNVDFWPDTSELAPDELFATSLTYAGGATAMLYSAFREKTVVRQHRAGRHGEPVDRLRHRLRVVGREHDERRADRQHQRQRLRVRQLHGGHRLSGSVEPSASALSSRCRSANTASSGARFSGGRR
jgi:hypothetical protein